METSIPPRDLAGMSNMPYNVILPSELELRAALFVMDRLAASYVLFAHDKAPDDQDALARLQAQTIGDMSSEDPVTCSPRADHNGRHETVADHARKRILQSYGLMLSAATHRDVDATLSNSTGDRLLLRDAALSMKAMHDLLEHVPLLAWDDSERLLT